MNPEDIPPFLRKPASDSIEWSTMKVEAINCRIAWLAKRGMRPHANLIETRDYHQKLMAERARPVES